MEKIRKAQERRLLSCRNADNVELGHGPIILIGEGCHERRRQWPPDLGCQALAEPSQTTIRRCVPLHEEEGIRLDDAHALTPPFVHLEVVGQEDGEPETGILQQLYHLAADAL